MLTKDFSLELSRKIRDRITTLWEMTIIASRVISDIWDKLIERHESLLSLLLSLTTDCGWRDTFFSRAADGFSRWHQTMSSDSSQVLGDSVFSPHRTRNVCASVKVAKNSSRSAWTRGPSRPPSSSRRNIPFFSLVVQLTLSFATSFVSLRKDSSSIEGCNADRSRERIDVSSGHVD
jgi:hypothetical protein